MFYSVSLHMEVFLRLAGDVVPFEPVALPTYLSTGVLELSSEFSNNFYVLKLCPSILRLLLSR